MSDNDRMLEGIFSEAGLPLGENLKQYLAGATMRAGERIAWVEATSSAFAAKLLERALENHATALNASATASDKHARSLSFATWVLASATLALVLVTVLTALGVIGRAG